VPPASRLEEFDLLLIEEPADPFDLGALKKISEHVNIPVAIGERTYTRHGFRRVLEMQVVDILQPDIGNTGGILETKKIAAMTEAYNMRIQPHVCASPVATAAALQLDACTTNVMIQEVYPYRPRAHSTLSIMRRKTTSRRAFCPFPIDPGSASAPRRIA
jgi:galactonate dehydratase